jgi:hypothetical protein
MIKVFNSYVGGEIAVNSFSLFVSVCKLIAQEEHTLEDHREYTEYGFGRVTFETDRFGGGYASFNFDLKTNAVTYAKGQPEQEEITDLKRLIQIVSTQRKRLLKVRDLKAVAERINAEY